MFTVKNTPAGAIFSGVGLFSLSFVATEAYPTPAFPAIVAVQYVWFLLAHLRLKDRARLAASS